MCWSQLIGRLYLKGEKTSVQQNIFCLFVKIVFNGPFSKFSIFLGEKTGVLKKPTFDMETGN